MKWRKLWKDDPQSSFSLLSITTKAIAARLVVEANEEGYLAPDCGEEDPASVLCKSIGVPTKERKVWKKRLKELLDDGWIVAEKKGVRIKNFKRFQAKTKRDFGQDSDQYDPNVVPTRTNVIPMRSQPTTLVGGNSAESLAPNSQEEKRREEKRKEQLTTVAQREKKKRGKGVQRSEVEDLFAYWKGRTSSSRAKLVKDSKREKLLREAIRTYGMEDCKRVVDGAMKSPYHQGRNDRGQVYLKCELLFRGEEKIEQFLGYCDRPPKDYYEPTKEERQEAEKERRKKAESEQMTQEQFDAWCAEQDRKEGKVK